MRTLLWSVLASVSAFAGGGSTALAAAPVATAESLVERFVAAWNSHDLAAFEKLFTSEVTWVATFDARHEGREAVLKDFRIAHEGWAKSSSVAASDALVTNLNEHLRHEEQDGLPMMGRVLSEDQWTQFGQGGGARVADSADVYVPWLLDGARNAEDVLDRLPPPLREGYVGGWRDAYAELTIWP